MVSIPLIFSPDLAKIPILTNLFSDGLIFTKSVGTTGRSTINLETQQKSPASGLQWRHCYRERDGPWTQQKEVKKTFLFAKWGGCLFVSRCVLHHVSCFVLCVNFCLVVCLFVCLLILICFPNLFLVIIGISSSRCIFLRYSYRTTFSVNCNKNVQPHSSDSNSDHSEKTSVHQKAAKGGKF